MIFMSFLLLWLKGVRCRAERAGARPRDLVAMNNWRLSRKFLRKSEARRRSG
jgi:hypothetical protein